MCLLQHRDDGLIAVLFGIVDKEEEYDNVYVDVVVFPRTTTSSC